MERIINVAAVIAGSLATLPVWSQSMKQSVSRPPAPVVAPVEHNGIRYEQDQINPARGDRNGGYLIAVDAETGERLWRVQVYQVPDQSAEGISGMGRYFRSLQLVENGIALEIENEAGGRYRVDLTTRTSVQISGPEPGAEHPSAPVTPKPEPR
jgi:outer membrane protein assembly factor BamB